MSSHTRYVREQDDESIAPSKVLQREHGTVGIGVVANEGEDAELEMLQHNITTSTERTVNTFDYKKEVDAYVPKQMKGYFLLGEEDKDCISMFGLLKPYFRSVQLHESNGTCNMLFSNPVEERAHTVQMQWKRVTEGAHDLYEHWLLTEERQKEIALDVEGMEDSELNMLYALMPKCVQELVFTTKLMLTDVDFSFVVERDCRYTREQKTRATFKYRHPYETFSVNMYGTIAYNNDGTGGGIQEGKIVWKECYVSWVN